MISVHLQGQLGNQLFQVAAAIGTADKFGCEYVLPEWKQSSMFAGTFNFGEVSLPRYTEPHFHYTEITQTNIELFGYFQSSNYFKNCENEIRRKFAPSQTIKQYLEWRYRKILKKPTCSLHVRRGDYLQLSEYHYNLETGYYESIQSMFPGFYYVCFSDDIDWCKKNIKADYYVSDLVENEFHLMSMMKNNIIANSSFSWWASWLGNPKGDKMVFAPNPKKWFGPKKSNLNVSDLYCKNWIYEK